MVIASCASRAAGVCGLLFLVVSGCGREQAAPRARVPRARPPSPMQSHARVTDEECARVVLFLASRLAAAVTGQSIDVNAGETMR